MKHIPDSEKMTDDELDNVWGGQANPFVAKNPADIDKVWEQINNDRSRQATFRQDYESFQNSQIRNVR